MKTRILTSDQILDAAISLERGKPINLDLARFIQSKFPSPARMIVICARIARHAGSTCKHVSELHSWVEQHEGDRDFLLALHREVLALRGSCLNLYDGEPDALPKT